MSRHIDDILRDEPQTPREWSLMREVRTLRARLEPLALRADTLETATLGMPINAIPSGVKDFKCIVDASMARENGGYHLNFQGYGSDGTYRFEYYVSNDITQKTFDVRVSMAAIAKVLCERIIKDNS